MPTLDPLGHDSKQSPYFIFFCSGSWLPEGSFGSLWEISLRKINSCVLPNIKHEFGHLFSSVDAGNLLQKLEIFLSPYVETRPKDQSPQLKWSSKSILLLYKPSLSLTDGSNSAVLYRKQTVLTEPMYSQSWNRWHYPWDRVLDRVKILEVHLVESQDTMLSEERKEEYFVF